MKKEMNTQEGLKGNLELIIENAKDLLEYFEGNLEKQKILGCFCSMAEIYLGRLNTGKLKGKEQEIFEVFMPVCAHLNQQWHKYCSRED